MQSASNVNIEWQFGKDYGEIARSGTVDLSQEYVRKSLAAQVLADIDTYAVAAYGESFRSHLGASVIGAECTRQTWYGWRWMRASQPGGRMQRLFQRGHLEEARYEAYLKGIGAQVWLCDEVTGKQYRVSRLSGHFGGSLDAIIQLPPRYGFGNYAFLGEFKTKGQKKFPDLQKKGIMLSNPQHYDQMCTYGAAYQLPYCLYFSTNKDTDEMYVEVVGLNPRRAEQVEAKAAYIISQQQPPPRVAENPTSIKCKGCDFHGICHNNHMPARNCRSCVYAAPGDNASWYCHGHQQVIPPDFIPVSCQNWTPIQSPKGR